jgi:protein-L-isoaspartate(D-aspartate) O-methyltransferase
MARRIDAELGPFSPAHLRALEAVPRERFVRVADESRAEIDAPLPLDDGGDATVSAPHAYLLSYRLCDLGEGDRLLELGSGSGYGAALAAEIVGPAGAVVTLEIDEALAELARTLAARPNVRALRGDAADAAPLFRECNKVVCTFAVDELPRSWLEALPRAGELVAPVGAGQTQSLVRVARDAGGALSTTRHGAVRYVRMRRP